MIGAFEDSRTSRIAPLAPRIAIIARGGAARIQRRLRAGHRVTALQKRSVIMNWNRIEGNWKELRGKVRERWGNLTDDDLDVIAGKQDQLNRPDPATLRPGA